MRHFLWLLIVLIPAPAWADDAMDPEQADLAERAALIFEQRCYRCHGGASGTNAGLDVLNQDILLQPRGDGAFETVFVVPGEPDNSRIWQMVDGGDMPRPGSPESVAMTDAERQTIREWIAAGAPFARRRDYEIITDAQALTAIRAHLSEAQADDRPNLRYFTLHHLHNNPTTTAKDLRYTRAALSKLLNSLNMHSDDIVLPEALAGTSDTVYFIDLRDFNWDAAVWGTLLDHYPYGVHHEFSEDDELKQLAADLMLFSGTNMPAVRADWFVVYAVQPPLYNILLDLPETLDGLEQLLGIDIEQNFLEGDLDRAGFTRSGVSQQNRLIERHEQPAGGYFWISYDFQARRARGDLVRFPLGPIFDGNPFLQQAFQHDGGEVIWSLPNGMQAYLLVQADGARIDDPGPISVVYDSTSIMGTPAIVNGVSCMNCHKDGMITRFSDEVRLSRAVGGPVREHVLEIYPTHEEMQELIGADQQRFLAALAKVAGPFLEEGDEGEPIGKVVSRYFADLSAEDAACELGLNDPAALQLLIRTNPDLLALGLGVWTQDPAGSLKRVKWEALEVTGPTLIQEVLRITQPGCMPKRPRHCKFPDQIPQHEALGLEIVMWRNRFSVLTAALVLTLWAGSAQADVSDSVVDAMARLVEKVKPTLEGRNVSTVCVGQFVGPQLTSGGPEIQEKLGTALEEAGFTRDDFEYDVTIRGRYEQNEVHDDFGQVLLTVRIVAQLFDANGRPIVELDFDDAVEGEVEEILHGAEAVPRLLGISTSIPPNLQEPDRSERLLEDQSDSPSVVDGSIVWSDSSQTYGIEVSVREASPSAEFTPREATERTSRNIPFVSVEPTEVYQIRLINNSDHEAAVLVTIDGISVFEFYETSEEESRPTYWIVAPHSAMIVRGWKKNDSESYEFLVTGEFPDTAAARLNYQPNEQMGDICAQFSASWEVGADPPRDEAGDSRGTALGDIIEDAGVRVQRNIGNVRSTLHVRYERD